MAVQVGRQRGLYVGWEFSGVGGIRASTAGSADELTVHVGNLPGFRTDIEIDETFLVPPAFVGCYAGDIDEGSYSLHRFVLEKLRPAVPKGCPDPILAFNGYMASHQRAATEASSVNAAQWARMAGFESFTTDAVWFRHHAPGDWRWDPKRFPKQGRSIEQYLHGQQVRWGLWCAWTTGGLSADPNAASVRGPAGHPEWFQADYGPDWRPGSYFGAQGCLASFDFKKWAIDTTERVVTQNRLDYLKHDFCPIAVHCNKKTHRHRHGVDVSYWSTLGYYEVQENLMKTFPNLILENCSAGGGVKDFGVIQRSHYTNATDTLLELPDRQSTYDSTFALPPLLLQAITLDYHPGWDKNYYTGTKGDVAGSFLWRSAMMSAWICCPANIENWTPEQVRSLREAVEVYKEWIRPILQDAKVHHILPRPDGKHWDGMFYFSPSLKKGTLYIFRPDSDEETKTIKLKGLETQKQYWLWSEDGSILPGVRAGQQLMEAGVVIELPAAYTSDLIFLQDASLGKPEASHPPGEFRLTAEKVTSDPFFASAELRWQPSMHARRYRVLLSHEKDFDPLLAVKTVVIPSLTLTALPAARELFWKVEAISPGGRRFNADGPRAFTSSALKKLVGVTFASDMKWVKATMGAGANRPVHRDETYYKKPITITGKIYQKGIWTHSFNDERPADVVLDVSGRNFRMFKAEVGLDDASGGGSVQFQVLVDG
ncbi:MAG: alpha-galactosidase, partial [Planctomycetes bacterium]|nr:alpha-galactosidase [Planctomycetota bacterium]